jgi:hypothetical protein
VAASPPHRSPYSSAAGLPEQLRIVDDYSNPEDKIHKKRHPGWDAFYK